MKIETIAHRPLGGGIDIEMIEPKDIFDRADKINRRIANRHYSPMLNVWATDVGRRLMGVDMSLSTLRIVFYNENERVRPVWAACDFFDDAADRIVVICHLHF